MSAEPEGSRLQRALFGLVLFLLALMVVWWFWFMAHAVRREDALWRGELELRTRLAAATLDPRSIAGPLPGDPQLEVVPLPDPAAVAAPGGRLGVKPAARTIADHERTTARRRLMVQGEGTLLMLLVLACVGMLFRLVVVERRYRRDVDFFLSRVTHEMKTPLAGLKALLQGLRDGRVPGERVRDLCELGLRQAERQEHLIENLLTAHRLATSTARVEAHDLDVAATLREFAAHRAASMGAAAETHEVSVEDGLLARAHPGALQTILENLADNAFKYGARVLRLRADAADGGVRIVVSDDGEGFEPGRGESLFAPFHRGATTATRHGTGLGLSIARALAREMRGDLVAASDGPGLGARFTLTLPGAAPAAAAAREPVPVARP